MTKAVAIITPAASRDAVAAELEALGYGPGIPSAPYVGDQPAHEEETPTHYASHWWVNDNENTISDLESLRATVLADSNIVVSGDETTTLDKIDTDPADASGTFGAMIGDSIVLTHKEFSPGQWGWRAEMSVQSQSFEPGVRAIGVYADAACTQYLYTTAAFVLDGTKWATEWNEGKPAAADVHWAILWASIKEQQGTLPADADAAALFLRFGLPPVGDDNGSGELIEWAAGQTVVPGDLRSYEGVTYECLQGHTTLAGWEPPNVPALWTAD